MSAARDRHDDGLRIGPLRLIAIWTLYGAVSYSQWALLSRPVDVPAAWKPYGHVVLWMGPAWTWALLTPLVAVLIRRWRPRLSPLPILVHAAGLLGIHALVWSVNSLGLYLITTRVPTASLAELSSGASQTLLLYLSIGLAVFALDHARVARRRAAHAAQLEGDLARARLDTLRRQLQPHFLFNTLNTIAALIDTDPPRAGLMVARLGELLRHSLERHQRPLIPLAAELDFVRLYTDIERVRFESWLQVSEEVEAATLDASVPPMILQPLVENAIRHGIAPTGRRGRIVIRASMAGRDRLLLQVWDDGAGLRTDGSTVREGLGLRATRERLLHLFGEDARLELRSDPTGTGVTIDLPFVRDVDCHVQPDAANVPAPETT